MAAERSPLVDYAIIILLLLNLGVASYVAFRPAHNGSQAQVEASTNVISDSQAEQLAAEVVKLYNARDNEALYAKLDTLAKAQISKDSLTAQMERLYPLMGQISDVAYSNAVLAGNDAGRDYYNLLYKVRLTGSSFDSGELKLVVTRRDEGFGLVGFFLNATQKAQ